MRCWPSTICCFECLGLILHSDYASVIVTWLVPEHEFADWVAPVRESMRSRTFVAGPHERPLEVGKRKRACMDSVHKLLNAPIDWFVDIASSWQVSQFTIPWPSSIRPLKLSRLARWSDRNVLEPTCQGEFRSTWPCGTKAEGGRDPHLTRNLVNMEGTRGNPDDVPLPGGVHRPHVPGCPSSPPTLRSTSRWCLLTEAEQLRVNAGVDFEQAVFQEVSTSMGIKMPYPGR